MPLRNVATTFTIEQQRLEINSLAADVNNIAIGVTSVGTAATANALAAGATGEDLTLSGTLTVNGTQTILNTATLEVEDKNIVIAKGSSTDAAASGGGITLKGADDKTISYSQTGDKWVANKNFEAPNLAYTSGGQTFSGNITIQTASAADLMIGSTGTGESRIYLDASNGDFSGADYAYIKQSDGAGGSGASLRIGNMNDGGIQFLVGEGFGGAGTALTITNGGDVKIGLDSVTTRTDSAHFGFNITGKSGTTGAGSIFFNDSADNCDGNIAADDGVLMITADYSDNTAGSAIKFRVDGSSEKMSINSDGQINLGTNGVNQAQFCQAGNNHYIVGQAADNVAALEVYSQHGSSYNKISFGVYDNRTGSKSASFLIRGDGQVEDSKGPLRSVPATEPGNANYTLVASDAGKYVDSQGTGREITVPSGTFSQGDVVTILRATSGDVTIKQGSGLTMYHSADGANTTTGDRTLSQRGMVTMIFVSANYCYISGTGLS